MGSLALRNTGNMFEVFHETAGRCRWSGLQPPHNFGGPVVVFSVRASIANLRTIASPVLRNTHLRGYLKGGGMKTTAHGSEMDMKLDMGVGQNQWFSILG